ncbi:IucA/IucC family protein [Nonomuraea sp. NPDC050556]|uniref:IucA/IucC family protein n=1 Tax=Nonomuraea sp. NPDC050556 TaxID=3364369 RepID=UPI0037A1552A
MREPYLAARVLDALLRENYGGLAERVTRSRDGVALVLADGRSVRLAAGVFQDFVVAPGELLGLEQVLHTLAELADEEDAEGVAAFFEECVEALAGLELLDSHRPAVLGSSLADYETLAAFVDHPIYPTSRARSGLSEADLLAYAPEFAPSFELRWAAVRVAPGSAVHRPADAAPWWPSAEDVGLPKDPGIPGKADTHALFPVHPLSLGEVERIEGVVVAPDSYLLVRPTLSMRTVAVDERTHLKLPLATSTLGRLNRRSIKPATLDDGARAELLVRELADPGVLVADEQTYGHAGHEYLAWMIRKLPAGRIVPVAALPQVMPEALGDYLRLLLRWNVRLFVEYGVALEAHQQNLAVVVTDDVLKLLVKDNDGLLASPSRLAAAGVKVPDFADERMLTDDPHALADVFVTITLHLAATAVASAVLPADAAARLVRDTLTEALAEHGDHPMAKLLRARTLDAARLTGKSMITAGTLKTKQRSGARDINKFYGTSGPNYLRRSS